MSTAPRLAALITAIALAGATAGSGTPAHATSFTVNTTHDAIDITPGDGVCADSGGACTLRAAIEETNALSGPDAIAVPAGTYQLTHTVIVQGKAVVASIAVRGDLTLSGSGAAGTVVVDPGPLDEPHLQELAQAGPVELILITHRHADHTAAAARFSELTGAPVRAMDPAHCHGGSPLADGEVIHAAGAEIRVVATPGHTSDSVCFHLPADGAHGSVLTGDTILGFGTTVLDYPDGTLGDYLASLHRLERLGAATVLPAHGPLLPALDTIVRA